MILFRKMPYTLIFYVRCQTGSKEHIHEISKERKSYFFGPVKLLKTKTAVLDQIYIKGRS